MHKTIALISLTRPANAALSIFGVVLGFWFSKNSLSIVDLALLSAGTFFTLAFGNVINDIKDINGDRLNHPKRALPSSKISIKEASIFAVFLAALSIGCGFLISPLHFYAILAPLILLTIYTLYLKAVPLVGNFLVSTLVSYTLFFGAMGGGDIKIIIVPALLAFLLNFEREIIKDIEDENGDRKTGVKTTATLPKIVIHLIFIFLSFSYLALLTYPYIYGYFGKFYLYASLIIILPLHITVSAALLGKFKKIEPSQISSLIKIEMLLGLSTLAIDKLI